MSDASSQPDAPSSLPRATASRPRGGFLWRLLQRLPQRLPLGEREAYFARATDLADLERRQRAWEQAASEPSLQSMVGWR